VFVALAGLKAHGARFAAGAVAQGASVILTDHAGVQVLAEQDFGDSAPVIVQGPQGDLLRGEMAQWASRIYGAPSQRLSVSGLTGTNGKTTTAFFLDAIHRWVGERTALLGTVEMRLADVAVPSTRTTVESPVLQGFFSRCVQEGIDHVTMEVSSHALALARVDGTRFGVVGFTNLQHDHLDFHHTMDEYFEAKASLFSPGFAAHGVVVADDKWGRKLAVEAAVPVDSITTRLCDEPLFDADWRVTRTELSRDGLGVDFTLTHRQGEQIESHSPLLGAVNVSNAALATVMALRQGVSPEQIRLGLQHLAIVPGRMEVVSQPGQPLTIVDYAHTAEALEFALDSLRTTHHMDGVGRLIVVFGAAGDRDASKRPFMGAVAGEYADVIYVTDDDPYSEDPAKICDEVAAGVFTSPRFAALSEAEQHERLFVVSPREEAIAAAIASARLEDTVLIAGRGHELIQDLDGYQHELDDRVFARARLAEYEAVDEM
jgi:UDP-N-acetylmuramoyl-L-alanyl-D-glutamate--2,6-diaminopimelate ligase